MQTLGGNTNPRGWYDEQETQQYPLRAGQDVPRSILSDLSVSAATTDLWISALTVDNGNVSLVLSDQDGIAAYLTETEVVPGRPYALSTVRASGAVVFGSGISNLSWRNPSRIEIYPRCVQPSLESQSLLHREGFLEPTQALRLTGAEDVRVRYGTMGADGSRPALFIGLDTDNLGLGVHEKYLGPCDRRPAMRNCEGNEGIRSIAAVNSDCCNTLYVEFQGVAMYELTNYCGVALDLDFSLTESCPPRKLASVTTFVGDDCDPNATPPTDTGGGDGLPGGNPPNEDQGGTPSESTGVETVLIDNNFAGQTGPGKYLTPSQTPIEQLRPVTSQEPDVVDPTIPQIDVYGVALIYDDLQFVTGNTQYYKDPPAE